MTAIDHRPEEEDAVPSSAGRRFQSAAVCAAEGFAPNGIVKQLSGSTAANAAGTASLGELCKRV